MTFISEDLVTDKSECDTSPPTVPTEGDGIPRNIRLQGTCVGKNHPTATGYFRFFQRGEYRALGT